MSVDPAHVLVPLTVSRRPRAGGVGILPFPTPTDAGPTGHRTALRGGLVVFEFPGAPLAKPGGAYFQAEEPTSIAVTQSLLLISNVLGQFR